MEKKKLTTNDYIDMAAERAAKKVVMLQRALYFKNHYQATEYLLRTFKHWEAIANDPESYGFYPVGKSRDISIAPPKGSGIADRVEADELYVETRKRSYLTSLGHYEEMRDVVKQFEHRKEFIVIRMYYFGEDAEGHPRGDDERYTFTEIADELSKSGQLYSERTLRRWRTRLVQEMTVMIFGVDGALSIASRDKDSFKVNQESEQ